MCIRDRKKGDPVDPAVGVRLAAKVGDRVAAGETLCTVHALSLIHISEPTRPY